MNVLRQALLASMSPSAVAVTSPAVSGSPAPSTPMSPTALHVQGAVVSGDLCDMEVEHQHGWNALHAACATGKYDTVRILLDAGANLEVKTRQFGHTPLHLAACVGSEPIVRELLNRGAVLQARDEHGYTALHFAAVEGYRCVVETILEFMKLRGTIELVNELDDEGNSALTLAQRALNSKVAESIHAYLAENLAHNLVSPEEIAELTRWLADDVQLPQYTAGFISAGYTRLSFWAKTGITSADYRDIGVFLPGHQRIINQNLIKYADVAGDAEESENESGSEGSDDDESGSDASSEAS